VFSFVIHLRYQPSSNSVYWITIRIITLKNLEYDSHNNSTKPDQNFRYFYYAFRVPVTASVTWVLLPFTKSRFSFVMVFSCYDFPLRVACYGIKGFQVYFFMYCYTFLRGFVCCTVCHRSAVICYTSNFRQIHRVVNYIA
jgi:hypothetical protein